MDVVIPGPVARADLQPLCEGIRARIERSGADAVVCDVGALTEPDVGAVDAVARLCLVARRCGCTFRLRNVPAGLRDMLALSGLCEVVGDPPLRPGMFGQTEEWEEPGSVEERRDAGDTPV